MAEVGAVLGIVADAARTASSPTVRGAPPVSGQAGDRLRSGAYRTDEPLREDASRTHDALSEGRGDEAWLSAIEAGLAESAVAGPRRGSR